MRSPVHPCSGNLVAIGHAVVYYARYAHAFSARITCRHCHPTLNPNPNRYQSLSTNPYPLDAPNTNYDRILYSKSNLNNFVISFIYNPNQAVVQTITLSLTRSVGPSTSSTITLSAEPCPQPCP